LGKSHAAVPFGFAKWLFQAHGMHLAFIKQGLFQYIFSTLQGITVRQLHRMEVSPLSIVIA
jgi:hypothetical protein